MEERNISKSKIREVLFHETTIVISIIVLVSSYISMVILPLQKMEYDISTIESNHLTHIQASIKKIEEKNIEQDKCISNIDITLTKLNQILEDSK